MSKKLMILAILILISVPNIVSLSNYAFAQNVDTAWVRRYDGPGNSSDYASAMVIDSSDNICVTGWSYSSGTYSDYATIKYYPDGDTAWIRRYDGPGSGDDMAWAIAVDGSGNVYVTGESYGGGGTSFDCATIKYGAGGDTAWVRRYNGPDNLWDLALALAIDDQGNVYVAGHSYSSLTLDDYLTIKYDSNGDTSWVRRYNGPGSGADMAVAIAVDGSGNVYVTGQSYGGSGTSYDYATIKYDANGDTAWVRRYHGPANRGDYSEAMVVDDSGNVYVTGSSGLPTMDEDFATIKYRSNGDSAWASIYDGDANGSDKALAIAMDASGNIYVAGWSEGVGTYSDYATVKYDPSGTQLWVSRYNGRGDSTDRARAISTDAAGNIYVTGYSLGSGTYFDHATIKYYPNGDSAWVARYDGPGSKWDEGRAVAVDRSGNVYVSGYCDGGSHPFPGDYVTIKYVQTGNDVKDETGNREEPSEFTLSQNYPNPFNQATKMEFILAKSGFVGLSIYDILGRKVTTLVSERLSSGYKSVLWDGKNDAGKDVVSGIYFYQLKVGDFSETKKLVLLK